ncbi:glycosyltransferase, partial [bacterium]|nr:glycosyltransferase [bacterium]
IIDGGSTDGSIDIIKKYKNNISYWESKKDTGIYNAMNKGIKKTNGEYLQFLNSGDYLLSKEILKKVFSKINNKDIYYGSSLRKSEIEEIFEFKEPQNLTFKRFFDYSICHQSMFIKKEVFEKIGFYNEKLKIASDWEFNVKAIILNNCSLGFLSFPIVFYDNTGISSNKQKNSLKEKEQCLNQLIPARILADYSTSSTIKPTDKSEYENKIKILSNDLKTIQSSKFYKLWQTWNKLLKKIGIKK